MDEERDECCKDECCDEQAVSNDCCNSSNTLTVSGDANGLLYSSGATVTFNTVGTGVYYGTDPKPKTKAKDIIIKEMDYGYLVKIGCQTFCVETPKKLLKALKKYMKDPAGVEEQHLQGEFMESID